MERSDNLQRYVESLPLGLDSYPLCVQKASIYRQFIEMTPIDSLVDRLPELLRSLVLEPEPVSAWVSSVHVTALCMWCLDHVFIEEDAFVTHWYDVNLALLKSPLYRVLMTTIGPNIVLKSASLRWGAIHKGLKLNTRMLDNKESEVSLGFPPEIVPRLIAEGLAEGFRAIVEIAGGTNVVVPIVEHTSIRSVMKLSWS